MSAAVLFIGGLDSSSGAGLLRDAATARDCGVTARVAVTAVTAQTDRAVTAIQPVAPEVVAAQIAAAGPVGAVKLGMLATGAVARMVAAHLPAAPLVLDPVLIASSGGALLDAGGFVVMLTELLPRAALVTPNLPELTALARGLGCLDVDEAGQVAALLRTGCGAVLVKGGHADDPKISEDRLYQSGQPPATFGARRVATTLRGTGCQLASAIAGRLAQGDDLTTAVAAAKAQVQRRFEAAS